MPCTGARSFSWVGSLLLAVVSSFGLSISHAADPQSYTVTIAPTGNEALDAITTALGHLLLAAPHRERQRLAAAIERFAERNPTAYRDMLNGHPAPAVGELIREVIEAVDARPA